MNRYLTIILFTGCLLLSAIPAKADIIDDISNLFKAGNATEISKYLASGVEVGILTKTSVYTKAQATGLLSDFFKQHQPGSVKIVHKLTSNPNHLFAVLLLSTNNGVFRTSFSVSNVSGKFFITEVSFEVNKD